MKTKMQATIIICSAMIAGLSHAQLLESKGKDSNELVFDSKLHGYFPPPNYFQIKLTPPKNNQGSFKENGSSNLPLPLPPASVQSTPAWMSSDVGAAWSQGYKGQGTTIMMVDDSSSGSEFYGNLNGKTQLQMHGYWTSEEASMIAPSANIQRQDFTSETTVPLSANGLNVVNLSYAMYAPTGYSANQIDWGAQETSLISYAQNGKAVISKAAGNDSVAVGSTNASGNVDYLDLALKGASSAIFVGALSSNGSTTKKASMASYSNVAGSDPTIENQFLVVGVNSSQMGGLAGTSFAAPIITGYAAILGSKFKAATPTQITNQLLDTARQDTLVNYNPAVYGRGEASLSRALAPASIK